MGCGRRGVGEKHWYIGIFFQYGVRKRWCDYGVVGKASMCISWYDGGVMMRKGKTAWVGDTTITHPGVLCCVVLWDEG